MSILKKDNLAILWSHNERKHPEWLDTVMRSCNERFVWWDVGWPLTAEELMVPFAGYIWNTKEKLATHKALIERVERQPSEKLAEEIKESWSECNIHVNPNSPLLLYQEDKDRKCTLLKLTSLKRLRFQGKLADFVLAKQRRPITQAPQGVAIVIDPQLS